MNNSYLLKSKTRFGEGANIVIIDQSFLKKIIDYHQKKPIGVKFVTTDENQITGKFVFKNEKEKDYYKINKFGLNRTSFGFSMPKFFEKFVAHLDYDPQTKKYKFPKKYCYSYLIGNNIDYIQWETSQDGIPKPKNIDIKRILIELDELGLLFEEFLENFTKNKISENMRKKINFKISKFYKFLKKNEISVNLRFLLEI